MRINIPVFVLVSLSVNVLAEGNSHMALKKHKCPNIHLDVNADQGSDGSLDKHATPKPGGKSVFARGTAEEDYSQTRYSDDSSMGKQGGSYTSSLSTTTSAGASTQLDVSFISSIMPQLAAITPIMEENGINVDVFLERLGLSNQASADISTHVDVPARSTSQPQLVAPSTLDKVVRRSEERSEPTMSGRNYGHDSHATS